MRALIVDDSAAMLSNMKSLVESTSDLDCFAYSDPVEALEAARRQTFDIALIDYVMPVMDGIELIRCLRDMPDYAQVPIVMITTTVDEDVRIRALEAGATDFLPKSPLAAELKVRIRNLIRMSTAVHKLNDQAALLAREVETATRALLVREEEMIFRLSLALEYRDNDTGGHTLRVAAYSQVIAKRLGLRADVCRAIFLASPLHDVGKVAIPDAVLLKPGRLSEDEFTIIKGHSAIGERILGGSSSDLIQLAAEIAGAHHERWDGSGYPNGLSGAMIPLPARIVAIADVFDALTTNRPYKAEMSVEDALSYIEQERSRHFDPTCVDAFQAGRDEIMSIKDGSNPIAWHA